MVNWKWFIITGAFILASVGIYKYVQKNGIIDIFAFAFIGISLIFFSGLLFAVIKGE